MEKLTWKYSEVKSPEPLQPLTPMSKADVPLVVGWLQRIRLGSIFALIVVFCSTGIIGFWLFGLSPGRSGNRVVTHVMYIVGAVGVWLLVSPEPKNGKWLWFSRWIIRIYSIVLIGSYVALLVTSRSLSEVVQAGGIWDKLIQAISMSIWFCQWRYLRHLAMRLNDSALRKNFSVLMWITAVLMVFVWVIFIYGITSGANSGPPPETPSKVNGKTVTAVQRIIGFSILLFNAWYGWMMWRLSRKLRSAGRQIAGGRV